ncbi:DedA family protein [Arcanobacterium ihumii]|uniref:DedA family protein n=1 Tax=Arcanobacterium ihumii TaxID=2138162 RepID=UPI000F51DA2C|nr:VTT domain-containing protein [Arcanobacterium ihumii]
MDITQWLSQLSDPAALIQSFGTYALLGVAIIIFIESGVLFPFLPGDSLLVTAAVLHSAMGFSIWQILAVACVAAIAGDQVGFWLGRRFGRRLFSPNAKILRTDRPEQAEAFFARHGSIALVLGRFVPIVRTYVPLGAGISNMHYRHFIFWNVLGAISWVILMLTVGVALGQIPGITHSIDLIMIIIVGISVLPIIISSVNNRRKAKTASAEVAGDDPIPAEELKTTVNA